MFRKKVSPIIFPLVAFLVVLFATLYLLYRLYGANNRGKEMQNTTTSGGTGVGLSLPSLGDFVPQIGGCQVDILVGSETLGLEVVNKAKFAKFAKYYMTGCKNGEFTLGDYYLDLGPYKTRRVLVVFTDTPQEYTFTLESNPSFVLATYGYDYSESEKLLTLSLQLEKNNIEKHMKLEDYVRGILVHMFDTMPKFESTDNWLSNTNKNEYKRFSLEEMGLKLDN